MEDKKLCEVEWCVAYAQEGKACCAPHHKHGRHIHPKQYKFKPRPQTGRPWDDERPWYERQEYV